jgi:hypothetical protein
MMQEESDMTESSSGGAVAVGMSIIGYEIGYSRTKFEDPSLPISSTLNIRMALSGGKVPHHNNKPIREAMALFSEGPTNPEERVGFLSVEDETFALGITVTLPLVDFPGIWATLQLNRTPRLECLIERGTGAVNDVFKFRVESRGPLLVGDGAVVL